MGKFSRSKGKRFERRIATELRERFPQFAELIRRSIQSRQAEESDVTGIPGLWLECQDSVEPTPFDKLEQAIRDVTANESKSIPVAITHKTRTQSIEVTLRATDFIWMTEASNGKLSDSWLEKVTVQISWEAFLDLVEKFQPWLLEGFHE